MTTRQRHIEWLKRNYSGRFPVQLAQTCYHIFGSGWFTDQQIKDMVEYEVQSWRRQVRMAVKNRKAWAAKQAAEELT